ncbi:unnamed protein product [Pedinophyceae sp. YPF-701]|nr:unnamed protein product [Pedinophyceae sp. YPF-701]
MVKFLKPGKVVILLAGRYAGCKAVIVKSYDDGTASRNYGHAMVVGLSKPPRKVTKRQDSKTQAAKARIKTFVKCVNYQHLMPTRYSMDVDLKSVATAEVLADASDGKKENKSHRRAAPSKRVLANKEAKKVLEDRFKLGKNRWFFTKLKF